MRDADVHRYVGISVAGLTLSGDRKRDRDETISGLLNTLGGELAADKVHEHAVWQDSGVRWTLVRFLADAVGDDRYLLQVPFVSDR